MNYKTDVNGMQIFKNNEDYKELFDFFKSQGIEDEEEIFILIFLCLYLLSK